MSVAAEDGLEPELQSWFAFAEEKLAELAVLATGLDQGRAAVERSLQARTELLDRRDRDPRRHDTKVRRRVSTLGPDADRRSDTPERRRDAQAARLQLPLLPTTTIGSFPQTPELRSARAAWRAGRLDDSAYDDTLRAEIARVLALQEEVGLDVLVHGEPERDDMVRYFASELTGFALPGSGWVQSFGSRCVRPPVLYGDVSRTRPMTVEWATYAASRTDKPLKGMLTGPVTMLRWSFVRDDQPTSATATQLALALADEVTDLQAAGIAVIQVDEPGLREGLPLRREEHDDYLRWATRAFRLAVAPAVAEVQVHTHMCYAEFAGILDALANLEVDVISLEAARSAMADVGIVASSGFGGGIGPGVYDVHSPAVPSVEELVGLLARAVDVFGPERVWVNPDCGLKTRRYDEVIPVLRNLVAAAKLLRPSAG
jgi:5-methyltetrahydropteroyltriglutamate--homocysteine methyltransferase